SGNGSTDERIIVGHEQLFPESPLLLLLRCCQVVAMAARRFPPPWPVEEQSACFVVRDHNGQVMSISRMSRGGDQRATKRWIASNIAKLPGLLRKTWSV